LLEQLRFTVGSWRNVFITHFLT